LNPGALEVWLVSQSYLPYYGGITEHVWHLAERLAARGHRVRLWTGQPLRDGHGSRDPDPPGVDVLRLGHTLRLPSNGARACVTFGWGWRQRVAALGLRPPDIVHIQSPLEPFLPLWALRQLPGVKIGTFHTGGTHRHWGYRHCARWLAGPMSRLRVRLAVSPEAARYVAAHFPGDYRVMPNGVDLTRFRPRRAGARGAPCGELRVLFVGRCDPRKGLATLLEALALTRRRRTGAPHPHLSLVVVGDGPERPMLERRARALGVPTEFAGGVPRAQLPRRYGDAEIFVAPSTDGESFGVSLLEAMACGLPIVASRIPGYRETLRDSGAALLFDPGSARALAAALVTLAGDAVRRERMGEMGARFARRFDWELVAGQVEEVYRGVLGATRRGRAAAPTALSLVG